MMSFFVIGVTSVIMSSGKPRARIVSAWIIREIISHGLRFKDSRNAKITQQTY